MYPDDPMDRVVRNIVLGMLATLALGQACAGCSATTEARDAAPHLDLEPVAIESVPTWVPYVVEPEAPKVDFGRMPNTCDPLLWVNRNGEPRLSKRLPAWFAGERSRAEHQAEVRAVIQVVADEMGADEMAAEFLWRKAIMESSGNEGSVHVHGPDVAAGLAFSGHAQRQTSEQWADARVPVFVLENGELVQPRTARGNPATYDAWAVGRGLYGMVTPLYVPQYLGPDAPPWALCDPVASTVVAIWSIRKGLAQCRADRLRDAYRWISAGTCNDRGATAERRFDRLARGKVRGLRLPAFDAKAKADFGDRWPQSSTNPEVLLGVIHERLAQSS